MTPQQLYEAIELTEDEIKAAILEGKKKKYFYLKTKDYWQSLETTRKKPIELVKLK